MCWKTEAGIVQSVGIITKQKPNTFPDFLQEFPYVIFKEEGDMLGLDYHSVCINFEVDSRGTTPAEALQGLKKGINSFIDVTLKHFQDESSAYTALKEEIENRSEVRDIVYRAYTEVLESNRILFNEKLRPHFKDLYDNAKNNWNSIFTNYDHKYNIYTPAFSDEEIENLIPEKIPVEQVEKILVCYFRIVNQRQLW